MKSCEKSSSYLYFIKIIYFSYFLNIVKNISGYSKSCPPKDTIIVTQQLSGIEIKGKPKYDVLLFNNCTCPVSKVLLSCKGFQSTLKVDPTILQPEGDVCILSGGNPITPQVAIRFSYAWDPTFDFDPVFYTSLC